MPQLKVNRLKIPTFDLSWAKFNTHQYLLMAGGGGSAKSGVKNQILVAKATEPHIFEFVNGYFTDDGAKCGLCSGVAVGQLQDGTSIVCAIVESVVIILEMSGTELVFHRKCDFVADFASTESSVNCCKVLPNNQLATGGEDYVCRLWQITIDRNTDAWKVILNCELVGHTAPIMSISCHPTNDWLSTSSKDGTCKVWNTKSCSIFGNIPHHTEGIKELQPVGNKKVSVECRGSCFSPCGLFLYSIQSPRRGNTYLIKWIVVTSQDKNSVVAFLHKCVSVSKVPSTRLSINESGTLLSVGSSDGNVHVFDSSSLRKLQSFAQHDLPITGLGFAPLASSKKSCAGYIVSCSADNKMVSMIIRESWLSKFSVMEMIGILFTLILAVLMVLKNKN